ncbi:MAG: sensor domain-containing diguanylate cyclase [Pseudomonadota bacterium]
MLSLSDDHVFESILGPWPLTHGAALRALPADDVILGQAVGSDTLLLVVLILAVVAFLSLAGVFAARYESRQIARVARQRAHSMNELLRTVRMAESIADLGIWQYDPISVEQHWSDGMRLLFGVDHDEEFVAGDAETLLYANDIDLIGHVMKRTDERAPYTMRYDLHGFDGVPRSISVQACNLFGQGGEVVRIVAVVRDVTDQMSRERELEHSRLEAVHEAQKARALAETDALTGLANRRRVMAELDRVIIEARRYSDPLVMVVFDIDRFKQVNDTHGHVEGDKVLQRVSQIAINQARTFDLVGRVGGEEFVWILPRTHKEQAEQMAERLRKAVSHGSAVGPVPGVTISLGLAQLAPSDTSLTLFSRADEALYSAKEAGRNLVKLAA